MTEIPVYAPLRLVAGTPGAGKVLTSDASGVSSWQEATGGGGGGLQTRATASKTTASLAASASETGTIALAAAYRLYKITTSVPARVRLYTTSANRDADVARAIGTYPTGDHGLMAEWITTAEALSGTFSPIVDGYDGKATPDGQIPYIITNTDTGAVAITCTLEWIRTE